jgi:hypothetical protein
MEIQTYICRDEIDIPVTVEYRLAAPQRGQRDRFGAPLEPDYDAEIEIEIVKINGVEIETSCEEDAKIIERINRVENSLL